MKRLTVILALAILITSILPTVCFASTSTTATGTNDVYLINPVSVALHQNTLFVADKITQEQCLLHTFDIENQPELQSTTILDGNVNKVKVDGNNLFVIFQINLTTTN